MQAVSRTTVHEWWLGLPGMFLTTPSNGCALEMPKSCIPSDTVLKLLLVFRKPHTASGDAVLKPRDSGSNSTGNPMKTSLHQPYRTCYTSPAVSRINRYFVFFSRSVFLSFSLALFPSFCLSLLHFFFLSFSLSLSVYPPLALPLLYT